MKKNLQRIFSVNLILTLLVCMALHSGISIAAADAAWDGTVDTSWYNDSNPQTSYTLTTGAQLAGLASLVNSGNRFNGVTINLGSNIDLGGSAGHAWTAIGNANQINDIFNGVFDGNGYTVRNIYMTNGGSHVTYLGLFGITGISTVIKNTSVVMNMDSMDSTFDGALVGVNNGRILNCSAAGILAYNGYGIQSGGLVGYNEGAILNSYSTANVIGGTSAFIGGLVGSNDGSIDNCYAVGTVASDSSSYIGGFVGFNDVAIGSHNYWNTDAVQTLSGAVVSPAVGTGQDIYGNSMATGMTSADMKLDTFAATLTQQAEAITGADKWHVDSAANSGYPVFGVADAAPLSTSAGAGSAVGTTKITATADTGDTLAILVSSIQIPTPKSSDPLPNGATVYISGSNIGNVLAGNYVAVYEVSNGVIVKFNCILLTSSDIKVATSSSSDSSSSTASSSSSTSSSSGSSSSSSSSSSSGSGAQITGTATGSGSSGYTASVSAQQAAGSSVTVTLGAITVKDTGSVLSNLIGSNSGSTLRFTQASSSVSSEQTALAGSNSIVSAFDIDLFSVSSSGASTQLHQLGGNITITLTLTDAQKAQITDPSTAKLYYYNPDTKALEDMNATFDMTAGTVTFTTNHLSTFVLEQGKATNPKTGGSNSPVIPLVLLYAGSASGLIIISKRVKWKVKSKTGNK